MNTSNRLRVLLLCGGKSTEHEISIVSCLSVAKAIDREKFAPVVVGITREGLWQYYGTGEFAVDADNPAKVHLAPCTALCFPGRTATGVALHIPEEHITIPFDVAFPVLHGAFGEDGSIQGLFQMLGVPYVGCNFTASANCMDKDLTKIILNAAGFRTARDIIVLRGEKCDASFVKATLGLPVFVKPAKTGSSVGITKVKSEAELAPALRDAFQYDDKALIEEAIVGREIETGVLEKADGTLFVAHPGEVVPHEEFYNYSAKYLNAKGATLHVSADLTDQELEQVKKLAAKAFRALGCNGMSRIDFFLSPKLGWVLNEINTIPGFTSISLYPQMMGASGIPYKELITELLQNAIANFQHAQVLYTAGH